MDGTWPNDEDFHRPGGRRRKKRRIWPFVLVGVAILAGGIVVAPGLLTLPPSAETLRIPGLIAPVDVTIDDFGVPRIRAKTETDAAAALGYLHARDRMFQMELMRRAASGRLAELAGAAAIPLDRMARTLGERRHAERSFAALPNNVRATLVAYAAGVNAWSQSRGRRAGPEFLLLGPPEPWMPVDCLLWSETVSLWLGDNYHTELARAALAGKLSPEKALQLWPAQPGTPPPEGAPPTQIRQGFLDAWPSFPAPFTLPNEASNAWAVDGRHSATGAPLLAGDPHLRLGFPGLWYLARIETPDNVLVGATAPGVPFLVLGHNAHIAWSFTSSGIDTQDVFQEKQVSTDLYATPDGPKPFETRQERIGVRGGPDVTVTIRATRHGPVIATLGPNPGDPVLAVEMASLEQPSAAVGIYALNHAKSVAEAGQASPSIYAPVQNLTVADHDSIALFTTGQVPVRKSGDGSVPVAGADGAHDWAGYVSGDALPHDVAPASGVLVNANERTAPQNFPVFLGRDFPAPYRARRIHQLLDGQTDLTIEDFAAMQRDDVSLFAKDALPVLRGLPAQEGAAGKALALLRDWNGAMDAERPQPLIFNATMQVFVDRVLAANHVPEADSGPWSGFAGWLLTADGAAWCGGDCASDLAVSLRLATDSLAKTYGPDPAAWRWGAAHGAVFAHPLLGNLPLVKKLASRVIPVSGDDTTLFRGAGPSLGDFSSVHGPGFRGMYDLADLERSRFIVAPGQSGNFLSGHAWDMLDPWAQGATITISAAPEHVAQTVSLVP